jgi:hypothetical protein
MQLLCDIKALHIIFPAGVWTKAIRAAAATAPFTLPPAPHPSIPFSSWENSVGHSHSACSRCQCATGHQSHHNTGIGIPDLSYKQLLEQKHGRWGCAAAARAYAARMCATGCPRGQEWASLGMPPGDALTPERSSRGEASWHREGKRAGSMMQCDEARQSALWALLKLPQQEVLLFRRQAGRSRPWSLRQGGGWNGRASAQ